MSYYCIQSLYNCSNMLLEAGLYNRPITFLQIKRAIFRLRTRGGCTMDVDSTWLEMDACNATTTTGHSYNVYSRQVCAYDDDCSLPEGISLAFYGTCGWDEWGAFPLPSSQIIMGECPRSILSG